MCNLLWEKLIECQNDIIQIFDDNAVEFEEPGLAHFNRQVPGLPVWINRVWRNDSLRRCHIDVVDARITKGLWMMHVCCFPNLNNDAPIYGFDIIAGKNKITGAFHDFSPTINMDHDMISGYKESGTYNLTWDASDAASGMYFVKAHADGFTKTQKLMLIK